MITWDKVGSKTYESGLDRGVLYLPDGSAVPWNGLTAVDEDTEVSLEAIYYDGVKINDLSNFGEFSASMKALTYPDELIDLEGAIEIRPGFFVGGQKPQLFGLCYRTMVGNDIAGESVKYKIHLIYNVTAIPSTKSYSTLTDTISPIEFEWKITAIPEDIPGVRPTAHVVIDSDTTDPWLLEELEQMLYGDNGALAALLPMEDLFNYISEWYRIKITDNLDGTWTASTRRDGSISYPWPGDYTYFEIIDTNVSWIDEDTFVITDTVDITQVPEIQITDNSDGTWTAVSDNSTVISIDSITQEFLINDANFEELGNSEYQIKDTPHK